MDSHMIAETMRSKTKILFLVCSCSLVLLILAGTLLGSGDRQDRAYSHLKTFTQGLKLVQRHYVDEVELEQVMKGAYRGLVERLDPFSSYLDAEDVKEISQHEGDADVGIYLVRGAGGYLRVASVRYGSPAWEKGIRAGRWVEQVGGRPSKETSLLQAQTLLLGPEGSRVMVRLFEDDNGEEEREEVRMVRRRWESHLEVEILDGGDGPSSAHLRLLDLRPGASRELAALLPRLAGDGITHLVLDLRTNAGGEEEELLSVADLFLEEGELLQVLGKGEKALRTFQAGEEALYDGDLAVLVGHGTVGEAEALAAALKENGRAELLGARTLGKGYLQRFVAFEDGTAVHISVEEYRGPGGLVFQGEGVKPDVAVAGSDEEGEDPVLDAALESLREKKPASAEAA